MVAAPGFADLGRLTGSNQGIPDLQVAIYPGPFDIHTDVQLRDNITNIVYPQIVASLTTPVSAKKPAKTKRSREDIVYTGTIEEINRYFSDNRWSDGMAIVPPTVERVKEFLLYTDYAPDEEIAILPSANLRATPWNIAVNAIMAGCRPEHLPLLIAMVKTIGDPDYPYGMYNGSTHSFNNFFWVNGPLARQLNIDYGQGLVAHQTNQVLGRAMTLIERNIAGYRIKETQMGSFGKIMSWVLAEDEAASHRIGWEPYHVEKGFDRNANTVSTGTSTIWGQNLIPATSDPKILMQLMAYGITYGESFASGNIRSGRYVLVEPGVAEVLAAGGYTKQSLKEDLVRNARKITYEWVFSKVHGSFGAIYPPFEEELAKTLAEPVTEKGKLPPWYPRFPGWEEIETTPSVTLENLQIIVCGDPSRNKVQTLAGGGLNIMEVRLPPNWDELMAKAGYRPLREFYL